MKSQIIKSKILMLTIALLWPISQAETLTCANLSAPASVNAFTSVRVQRHLQGQFERITSNLSPHIKAATVEAQFQVDSEGRPVNIKLSSSMPEPSLTQAALLAIKGISPYPEPQQCYQMSFSYVPTAQPTEETEKALPQTASAKVFSIDQNSLYPKAASKKPHPSSARAVAPARPMSQPSPPAAATNDNSIGAYFAEVNRRVKRNWSLPAGERDKSVVVKFKIVSDGRLETVTVERSSGSATVDQAGIAAVRASAPFKHLPADCPKAYLEVQLTLNNTVSGH